MGLLSRRREDPAEQRPPGFERDWSDSADRPYRVAYAIRSQTPRTDTALVEFLLEEWVPALRSADGLVSVEVADSFEEDRKDLVTELWRSKSLHGEGVPGLWFGTHAAVYEKFTSIAAFYVLWEGIVLDAPGGG